MYAPEILGRDDDDGTMVESLAHLTNAVLGHRIVSAERDVVTYTEYGWEKSRHALVLTLDNGSRAAVIGNSDCCAYTEIEDFLLNPAAVDHVITGVGTTDEYTTWHIFADLGDVLTMKVGWSCGNPFNYGYGFTIQVLPADGGAS